MDGKQDKDTLFERHRENIYFRWGLTAFAVIVACIIVAQLVTRLDSVFGVLRTLARALSPVLYGLGIAYLLDPIVGRVENLLKKPLSQIIKKPDKAATIARSIGILAALVVLVLVAWALLSLVLPQLADSLNTIVGNMPVYYGTLSRGVMKVIDSWNLEIADFTEVLLNEVFTYVKDFLGSTLLPKVQSILVGLTTGVVGMARTVLNLVIGLIVSIYLLLGKKRFLAQAKKLCYGLLGLKKGEYVCNVCTFANQAFGGFIGGKIVDSAIIGVLCFLGMRLFKMPYPMLIAIIVGVTNIIPFFGPYLGAIPSALLLLVIDPMQCLYFIIFVLVLQQLDGNVIGPMILGDATGLSGFWVVVAILVFGSFYGIIGMVIGVPTFAVLYKIIAEITNRLLYSRGLSTASADYENYHYPPRPNLSRWRKKSSKTAFWKKKTQNVVTEAPVEAEAPTETDDTQSPA